MVKKDVHSKRTSQEFSMLNQQPWHQKNQYPHQVKGPISKPKQGAHTQVNASISSVSGLKSQLTQKEKVSSANSLLPEISGASSANDPEQHMIT